MQAGKPKKILVAYFSHSGNTRVIASEIHKRVGGDIFEIQSLKPYPLDYDAAVQQARQELDSGHKPALKAGIESVRSYDLVFIGYPIWWSTFPAPIRTFLSEHDFSGRTIVPFCTHGGSGLGRSATEISKLCPKSTVLDGIAIGGRDVQAAHDTISEWLQRIKTTK
jgi:flavodoxin